MFHAIGVLYTVYIYYVYIYIYIYIYKYTNIHVYIKGKYVRFISKIFIFIYNIN